MASRPQSSKQNHVPPHKTQQVHITNANPAREVLITNTTMHRHPKWELTQYEQRMASPRHGLAKFE
jgi:hypothetical protein